MLRPIVGVVVTCSGGSIRYLGCDSDWGGADREAGLGAYVPHVVPRSGSCSTVHVNFVAPLSVARRRGFVRDAVERMRPVSQALVAQRVAMMWARSLGSVTARVLTGVRFQKVLVLPFLS